jgi:N-acetylneuraminate synthase
MDAGYITIAGRRIGRREPCYVIAEIGLNHNGSVDLACRLVDAAVEAGVDAVKFQKRTLGDVYQEHVLRDPRHGEQSLQYIVPILKEFELDDEAFCRIREYCRRTGVTFLCTAWDAASVDFLATLGVPAYKIGSPDLTNHPLVVYTASTGKPLLLSTGMSTEEEIRSTLRLLDGRGIEYGLFHCVSTYPAAADEINLRFMEKLRDWSGAPVGYSGHERGVAVSTAAVAMGACLIERHLTLDRTMRGPDHSASLEPAEFAQLVSSIREVENAFGVPHRWITRGEFLNRRTLGKSLVAAADLPAGTRLTPDMIVARSPGLGIAPSRLSELVGLETHRPLKRDDPFTEADLNGAAGAPRTEPIDLGIPWGIVARFTDVDRLTARFGHRGMSLIEFHVSDRDLDGGLAGFPKRGFDVQLVVHAPEYSHDYLIDLCSSDAGQRAMSVARLQKTIDLARDLAPWFPQTGSRGPKVVIHVGGMAPAGSPYDRRRATDDLLAALRALRHEGVDLLLENLPPYPWFFGGRWDGHVLTDAETTAAVCDASELGLCLDTSHAALHCHRAHTRLTDFIAQTRRHVRHLHVSDAAGTAGEGLQIGEGEIDFLDVMPLLAGSGAGLVPEVWMGHQRDGAGFETALERLSDIMWTVRALRETKVAVPPGAFQRLAVTAAANVVETLRAIDANALGIAFVVDGHGVVLGVVTDGDIRRSLMAGGSLQTPITAIMNTSFTSALNTMTADEIRSRFSPLHRVIPVLDGGGRLVSVACRDRDIVSPL